MTRHRAPVQFQVRVSVNYIIWRAIHVFILDCYVYYSYTRTHYYWRAIANLRINLYVRVYSFSLQIQTSYVK